MTDDESRIANHESRTPPVSRAEIEAYARQITERFNPEKIILFGSYACGNPTPESDVDLMVVMDTPLHPTDQAVQIRLTIRRPFPLDLLVRPPEMLKRRIELGDFFLREVVERGVVLYERSRE